MTSKDSFQIKPVSKLKLQISNPLSYQKMQSSS